MIFGGKNALLKHKLIGEVFDAKDWGMAFNQFEVHALI